MTTKRFKILFITVLLFAGSVGDAEECGFPVPPKIIFQEGRELHQIWLLKDRDVYYSTRLPVNHCLSEFRNEVRARLGNVDVLKILKEQYLSFASHPDPRYHAEA